MGMFNYTDADGNFIIESGSNAIPVFKVSGSTTLISGSLIPGDPTSTASAELGSEATPWKELYVESASINFIDTKIPIGDARRKVRFSRKDIEDLKEGKSLNENGVISASGDMHVEGDSRFRGRTIIEGMTSLRGETQVTGALLVEGAADFKGHFRVNGNRIEEGELRVLAGLTADTDELNIMDGVTATTAELNTLDGIGGTAVHTQLAAKADVNNPRFTGAVAIGGVQATGQELTLTGDMSASGNLTLDGSMTVDGNSTMIGGWRMKNTIYYNDEPTDLVPAFGQTVVQADARAQNHFQVRGTNVDLIGIRGTELTGQIITINVEIGRRMNIHHAETGNSTSDILLPLGRDVVIRGPMAVQFIYSRRFERWHRLM